MTKKILRNVTIAGVLVGGLVSGYISAANDVVVASNMSANGVIQVEYANGDCRSFEIDSLTNKPITSCNVSNDGRVQVSYIDGSTSVFYISFDR